MSAISITEVLGSDGVSASRSTINSNFNTLTEWINSYASEFGIDINNVILDLTSGSTGKISAKTGYFNSITFPASGTALATINSSGVGSFQTISTTNLTSSGTITLSGDVTSSSNFTLDVGATASFDGYVSVNGRLNLGTSSSIVNRSLVIDAGLTAGSSFPDADSASYPHGGGYVTTASAPYVVTGTENLVYADLGSTGGFNLSVGTDGTTVSSVPAGFELTIINTNDAGGTINTGVQGSFYTGFNTNASQGGYDSSGITAGSGFAYRSALRVMWEPRVDQDSASQKGSWVVLSATNLNLV